MDKETSLDPDDWSAFRKQAHAALDAAMTHMEHRRDAPVWQAVPQDVRASLTQSLPVDGTRPDALVARIVNDFLPHDVGNTHPRFFGWVHGGGTPEGLLPEILAAAMNANLGGRDHVANEVERQVIRWCAQMFSFPDTAGGLVVSGTSMATLVALKTARDAHAGPDIRQTGTAGAPALVGYASEQAHGCIAKTFDILGLGRDALRRIACDNAFRMRPDALHAAIEQDRKAGVQPFCVIGTAGSVNVGAIDPLDEIADIAARERLWFHVDGAFGALAILNPELAPLLDGITRADSIAFDFHKWMHVNYDAGFILTRASELQRQAFSDRPDYLQAAGRGLAAGNPWFCEYGPELSRSFRALKIWFQIARFGTRRLGQVIARNCAQARTLALMVESHGQLELMAPVHLNIVCFRYRPTGHTETALDRLNNEIVIALQEGGIAAPSTTRLNGSLAIRVNLTNHRTRREDLEILVRAVLQLGESLS